MKRDDVYGLIGGVICLLIACYDEGWRTFWLVAGGGLIAWSAISVAAQWRQQK